MGFAIIHLHLRKAALLERQALKKSISAQCLEEMLSPEQSAKCRRRFTFTKCIIESVILGDIFYLMYVGVCLSVILGYILICCVCLSVRDIR